MKYTKKLLSLVLVLVLALALAVPGMAADITITNYKEDETYTAYKIFNYTKSGDGNNYAYTMDADSLWKNVVEDFKVDTTGALDLEDGTQVFTTAAVPGDTSKLRVNVASVFTADATKEAAAAAFAEYLSTRIPSNAIGVENNGSVISGLAAGYYFVDTSLGSLCSLFNSDSSQQLTEKNDVPDSDKKADKDTAAVGEEVTFTITVSKLKGADEAITVHDKMTAGLTFGGANSIAVYKGNADGYVESGKVENLTTNYVVKTTDLCSDTDNCGTFELTFTKDYVSSLADTDYLYIVYTAVVNTNAMLDGDSSNTAYLTYNKQTSTPDTPHIYTYKFPVYKYTGNLEGENTGLPGAVFTLSKNANGSNPIAFVATDDGYRVATKAEIEVAGEDNQTTTALTTPEGGRMILAGLAAGTYYLTETTAPAGYNLLTGAIKVEIIAGTGAAYTIEQNDILTSTVNVLNESGSILPSTGGMGTTIFYTLGGVLVVGAAILLVTKKRVHDVEG